MEADLREQVERINEDVYDHARIGAVIVTSDHWTIENGVLTPTLKVRRGEVEERFGETAESLARQAAESHQVLIQSV